MVEIGKSATNKIKSRLSWARTLSMKRAHSTKENDAAQTEEFETACPQRIDFRPVSARDVTEFKHS